MSAQRLSALFLFRKFFLLSNFLLIVLLGMFDYKICLIKTGITKFYVIAFFIFFSLFVFSLLIFFRFLKN